MEYEPYLEFMRGKPCSWCFAPPRSDPHHFGKRGKSQKCSDFYTVPLCRIHHDQFHDHRTIGLLDVAQTAAFMNKTALALVIEFIEKELL